MNIFHRQRSEFSAEAPESLRRKIFRAYESKRKEWLHYIDSEHEHTPDELSGRKLKELEDIMDYMISRATNYKPWHRTINEAEDAAICLTTKKFGINARQLLAIIKEGKKKKWG